MRRPFFFLVPVLGATALVAGCTTPYSQLVGQRYYRAPIDTYPVQIAAIDGEHHLREPVFVEPGSHRVTVLGPPTPSRRFGTRQTVSLDVKPCTRYYLVAVKPTPLHNDFTVKVDREEPVAGCRAG